MEDVEQDNEVDIAGAVIDSWSSVRSPTSVEASVPPSTKSCQTIPIPSTDLVLHRTPVHLDVTFVHIQTWCHLLELAASPAQQFWQGVLTKSCLDTFRQSVVLDELVALHTTAEHDLVASTRMITASDITAEKIFVVDTQDDIPISNTEHNRIVAQQDDILVPNILVDPYIADGDSSEVSADNDRQPTSPQAEESAYNVGEGDVEVDDATVDQKHLHHSELEHSASHESSFSVDLCGISLAEELLVAHQVEKQHLENNLQQQQQISQDFRSQLIDCEEKLEHAEARYREAERQRGLYEEESEETSQKLQKAQQESALAKKQLAAEKCKPAQEVTATQQVPDAAAAFKIPLILADRDRALSQVAVAMKEKQFAEEMLNVVIRERTDLQHQLRSAQQPFRQELSRVNHINDLLRDNVAGLEGQANDLLQQMERSDERVAELEKYNQTLLSDFTNKFIADPRDNVSPVTCTYNEARDLKQQVESAQDTSARFIQANNELQDKFKEETKKVQRLEEGRDLLENKCSRLAANYEVLQRKVENFLVTVPGVLKDELEVPVSEEEELALIKSCQKFQVHIDQTNRQLKEAANEISSIESSKAAMQRTHKAELGHRDEHIREMHKKVARIDAENFNMDQQLGASAGKIAQLEDLLKAATEKCEQWRNQCEHEAFGDMTPAVQAYHRNELELLHNEINALQYMSTELRIGKEQAVADVDQHKYWFASTIIKIEEWEAGWLYARARCDALEERFEDELRGKPLLRIKRYDKFENLSHDIQMDFLRMEDGWVEVATGFRHGRSINPPPEPCSATWSTFIAECLAWLAAEGWQFQVPAPAQVEGEVIAKEG